ALAARAGDRPAVDRDILIVLRVPRCVRLGPLAAGVHRIGLYDRPRALFLRAFTFRAVAGGEMQRRGGDYGPPASTRRPRVTQVWLESAMSDDAKVCPTAPNHNRCSLIGPMKPTLALM